MIPPETRVQIRRYFYAEHWKIGTIAQALNVHPDAVRRAVEVERFQHAEPLRPSIVDPYLPFVRETLEQSRLRATRLYRMIRDRGYAGSVEQLRRVVARLRPQPREAFLRLQVFPAEQGQVDWAYFGSVLVGRARRQLSCFVMTLSWSRALYLEFFFDQTMENFLRGHVRAFAAWSGRPESSSTTISAAPSWNVAATRCISTRGCWNSPRIIISRRVPVRFARKIEGGVERAIRFVRDLFWAGRTFTTLEECNRQAIEWRDEVAHQRPWPDDGSRTVAQTFAEEQPRLLPLPLHPFHTDRIVEAQSRKTIYVRFDLNDYSIPPEAVGRPLTLAASDTHVRILDGAAEIACHRRSYHGSAWSRTRRMKKRCCGPNARRSTPPAEAGWRSRFRKASPCWSALSPPANRPAVRPRNCSDCWICTAPPLCAVR